MDVTRTSAHAIASGRPTTPARERLAEVRQQAMRVLSGVLVDVLDRADDALFDFVQKSSSSFEQQEYFDTMRELRRQRVSVEQRFRDHLQGAFVAVERGAPMLARCAPQQGKPDELSLVEIDDLEEQLAAEQLAGAMERRHAAPLALIDRRLAVLAGIPPLGPSTDPLGPGHIVSALRSALRGVGTAVPPRLVLYKLFERELGNALGGLYSEINRRLSDIDVSDRSQHGSAAARDVPKSPKYPHQYPQPQRAPDPATQPSATAAAAGPQVPAQDVDELLPTLRALLAEYRQARRPATASVNAPKLDLASALNTLSVLQHSMPANVGKVIDNPNESLALLLKRELLVNAQRMGVAAADTALDDRGEESLELTGMLFDALLAQRNYQREVRSQLLRMVVPYAKASLLDEKLFGVKAHPARKLLNTVAEACDGNRGETGAERELLQHVEATVDRLVAEFNEDLAIFSELETEFGSFLEQHRHRADLAERRAAEAQRGKERLEQARAMATMELAMLIGAREAPPALAQFLGTYWTHHMAVVSLREGADSPRFQQARAAGALLWHAFLDAENGADLPEELHDELRRVLASSGVSGQPADDTLAAVDWVLQAVRLGRADAAAHYNLPLVETAPTDGSAALVAAHARESETPELAVVAGKDTLDFDPADVEKIKALEVGAWVEFIDEDGTTQPAKLSWISPISSRLLFVNRRGMRICANSAEELAIKMHEGTLVLRDADNAFERAMTQVLGKLRESVAS